MVVFVGAAGFFAARYFLANSWYVGVNEDGMVTAYQGIPEEIAGYSFREEKRVSDLSLKDLPEFLRDGPKKGIKVDSFEQALSKIEALEGQAIQERPERSPSQRRDNQDGNKEQDKKKRG